MYSNRAELHPEDFRRLRVQRYGFFLNLQIIRAFFCRKSQKKWEKPIFLPFHRHVIPTFYAETRMQPLPDAPTGSSEKTAKR
ncbi:hypothetical protein B5F34_12505 [Mediterranea sp. An20]|nr:hypothetical protein B5F34_12505 [Mediterranea sp. An20]